jgi:hypothetical protein
MNKDRIEQAILDNIEAEKRIKDIGETMRCWKEQELMKMITLNIIQRLIIKIRQIIK